MAKTAGIVVIGNEILSGKVVDTNSPYICQELRTLGVDVRRIVVVPDEIEVIASDVVTFSRAFDYVFTTGGVGPTHDDVTIEAIAHGLQRRLVIHPELDALLQELWAERPSAAREKMASVPEGAAIAYGAEPAYPCLAGQTMCIFSLVFHNSSDGSSIASRSAFVSCPTMFVWCM